MDQLGERIVRERSEIASKRARVIELRAEAGKLEREADDQERLLEVARFTLNQLPTIRIPEVDIRGATKL